jgi:LPS export ABC transporter protein LptC
VRSLIIVILGLSLTAGIGCERRNEERAHLPEDTGPQQVSLDAAFTLSEGGAPRAEILAARMEHYEHEDSTYAVMRGPTDSTGRVTAYLFNQGDSSATLRADRLVYLQDRDRFEAYGNVVVTTPERKRLESEHLAWYERDSTIRTPGFVQITTPEEDVRGEGLVADENLETYQIGRFTARVNVEDE